VGPVSRSAGCLGTRLGHRTSIDQSNVGCEERDESPSTRNYERGIDPHYNMWNQSCSSSLFPLEKDPVWTQMPFSDSDALPLCGGPLSVSDWRICKLNHAMHRYPTHRNLQHLYKFNPMGLTPKPRVQKCGNDKGCHKSDQFQPNLLHYSSRSLPTSLRLSNTSIPPRRTSRNTGFPPPPPFLCWEGGQERVLRSSSVVIMRFGPKVTTMVPRLPNHVFETSVPAQLSVS
jgi:hypothetical protein